MCGRYALHSAPEVAALAFGLPQIPAYAPRYNIAPQASVLIIRNREAAMVRWGLVPHWAKDPGIGARMNNARAETAASKPSFREAYRKRRCLIPANGFYEWQSEGGRKQPYYFFPLNRSLFAFAGLWEKWNELESCAILTIGANGKMRPVHDRMPVIIGPENYSAWLGGEEGLMLPCPDSAIGVHKVSRAVNNARNESPQLIDPSED